MILLSNTGNDGKNEIRPNNGMIELLTVSWSSGTWRINGEFDYCSLSKANQSLNEKSAQEPTWIPKFSNLLSPNDPPTRQPILLARELTKQEMVSQKKRKNNLATKYGWLFNIYCINENIFNKYS